mgnify:CR=1 FL=1
MSELMDADAWMHHVLNYKTPLDVCEKRFRTFSLMQDKFIRDELQKRIIPNMEIWGYADAADAYKKILELLESVIADKQKI